MWCPGLTPSSAGEANESLLSSVEITSTLSEIQADHAASLIEIQ